MTEPVVNKLASTDAFVVVDLPHADSAEGIVRCARRVLVDSTRTLARSRTYAWALLGHEVSGASAGINAVGDERAAAIGAFCSELAPEVTAGRLILGAGKGLDHDELKALGELPEPDHAAFVAGVVACAESARSLLRDGSPGLGSASVAIEFDGGAGDLLADALTGAGADIAASGPGALETPADVLFFGSRPSVVDHEVAAELPHRVLVPTAAPAFTPRALAVARRREVVVLPDFLTTAGPLASRVGRDPAATLAELTGKAMEHDEGPVLGACIMAEDFLATWCDDLPFGRPIG